MEISQSYKSNKIKKYMPRFFQYLVLSLVVIIVLVPILMIIFSALKTRGEAMAHPYTLPIPAHWENFAKILEPKSAFWGMLRNSVLVMAATTIGVLFACSLAAFVFARMNFRGKDLIFNFLGLGIMFPINIAILPVFLLLRQMDITNTLQAVILVQLAFQLSANIMILRGFFMAVPIELQDAAYIDGCNSFDFFRFIMLPLVRPALAAVAALTMIGSWNDLLVPLVIIDKDTMWTLPLGTMQFQGQYGQDISLVAAFVVMSAIPAVIFYLFFQRQIVSGLTAGALKG